MSAVKPIIRELKQAALKGFGAAKDKLHHVAENITRHVDEVVTKVKGQDVFDGPGSSGSSGGPGAPTGARPGFNADGTVNPDDFRTPRDGAYYWSGMYPRKGEDIGAEIAGNNNATTLEMLLDERGIEMPEWNDKDPAATAVWTQVSEAYASGASGTVHAVLGDNIRPDAVWWSELARIEANDAITTLIKVDPDTLVETVIWTR